MLLLELAHLNRASSSFCASRRKLRVLEESSSDVCVLRCCGAEIGREE
jgi:hypothetical protein